MACMRARVRVAVCAAYSEELRQRCAVSDCRGRQLYVAIVCENVTVSQWTWTRAITFRSDQLRHHNETLTYTCSHVRTAAGGAVSKKWAGQTKNSETVPGCCWGCSTRLLSFHVIIAQDYIATWWLATQIKIMPHGVMARHVLYLSCWFSIFCHVNVSLTWMLFFVCKDILVVLVIFKTSADAGETRWMLLTLATSCGQVCYLFSFPLCQRQSPLLADAMSRDTCLSNWLQLHRRHDFHGFHFHCWFVSIYCLTMLKELCSRCVMGQFTFCRSWRDQR